MPEKNPKVKLVLKNFAILPNYFHYTLVLLRQKARLRPELSPKFLPTLGPNPTWKARPDLQLWPKASLRLFKNGLRISKKTTTKTTFLSKIWFYNHFFNLLGWIFFFFWKIGKNVLERNVSAKNDSCCKSNRSIASSRRTEFLMTKLLWTYLVISVARGRAKPPEPQLKCHQR